MKTQLSPGQSISTQVLMYIICCTVCSARSDTIQLVQYSISKNGKTIGSLTAQSINTEKGSNISLKSSAKTRLVFEIQILQNTENRIGDHFLHESSTKRTVNGSIIVDHGLKYEQGIYKNIGAERVSGPLPEKIAFTSTMLYFTEPEGVRWVYAEFHKKMIPLEGTATHTYRLKIGDNEYSDFYYQYGVLQKVIATSFFGTTVIARENATNYSISKQ